MDMEHEYTHDFINFPFEKNSFSQAFSLKRFVFSFF